ncbi:hypothetical protein R3P38DRAFT_2957360 [Favolaschia claudopus]|uniref:F-box domain-containing protein n=1 Tax=Favolaschia claudopus TaxID=2862362 RepID=A0AAW0B9W1_9AGAR
MRIRGLRLYTPKSDLDSNGVMQATGLEPTALYTQLAQLPSGAFEIHAKILIEAAEANVARIESQIRDLERLRDRERGIVAQLRMAIAPIRKLPAELLAEIFLIVRDSLIRFRERDCIRLSHVCAHWRSVAQSTPQLWTSRLVLMPKTTPSVNHLTSIKQWLDRSAPFSIPIVLQIPEQHQKTVDPNALVAVLATAAQRWKTADFDILSLDVLSHIPAGSLQSLKVLHLRCPDVRNHSMVPAFLTAGNLRRVILDTRFSSNLLLPWSQLTYIYMAEPDPMECLDILVRCATLESAFFTTHQWEELPEMSHRPMTTLERLKFLHIDFELMGATPDSLYYSPFITCLALPALKTLSLAPSDSPWSSAEFTQFQLRCPNLEVLSVERSTLSSNDLLAVLRHAPSLLRLELECCMDCIDDSVFVALQYSPTHLNLAPKLKELSCTDAGSNFSEEALDTMIQSRWWTDNQLPSPLPSISRWSSISIHCSDDLDEEVSDWSPWFANKLETYQAQGLGVHVQR